MSDKTQAISQIRLLMDRHGITLADIRHLEDSGQPAARSIPRLFYYIGGILIFAGIGIFTTSFWQDIGFGGQVCVTLGIGFFCYLMGLAAVKDVKFDKAATPLFLISSLLQPTGILLILDHYSTSPDPPMGLLIMSVIMLAQQVPTLIALKRPALVFTSLVFYGIAFTAAYEVLNISSVLDIAWVGLTLGTGYLMISAGLVRTDHYAITPFWFFVGSVVFLVGLFDLVDGTAAELLYLGAGAAIVYAGTVLASRVMVFMGTLGMLCYIGYFSYDHFQDSLGWPLVLIIIGISFMALGSFALKLSARIKQGA